MDTAASPSRTARPTPALTIRSRVRLGFGPLRGRSRRPQAASTLAGKPVASPPLAGRLTSIAIEYSVRSYVYDIRRKLRARHRGGRTHEVLRGRRGAGRHRPVRPPRQRPGAARAE